MDILFQAWERLKGKEEKHKLKLMGEREIKKEKNRENQSYG